MAGDVGTRTAPRALGAGPPAKGLPNADFVVFEESAHMTYVEENQKYLQVVREFLGKHM